MPRLQVIEENLHSINADCIAVNCKFVAYDWLSSLQRALLAYRISFCCPINAPLSSDIAAPCSSRCICRRTIENQTVNRVNHLWPIACCWHWRLSCLQSGFLPPACVIKRGRSSVHVFVGSVRLCGWPFRRTDHRQSLYRYKELTGLRTAIDPHATPAHRTARPPRRCPNPNLGCMRGHPRVEPRALRGIAWIILWNSFGTGKLRFGN